MCRFFKIFSNTIPVKGYSRSIILDLQRNKYVFIPNALFDIITNYEGKSIEYIKNEYNNEFEDIITEYFDFLYKEELIFWLNTEKEASNFPKINYKYSYPFKISNAIIDIEDIVFITTEIVKQLDELNIKNLQIRIFNLISFSSIKDIYNLFDGTMITNIEFVLTYSEELVKNKIIMQIEKLPKITRFVLCASPDNELIKISPQRDILYLKSVCNSPDNCGQIKINHSNINYEYYSESIHYNTCLNGKISIDSKGYIKNCPSCKTNFGHIVDTKIHTALQNNEFYKLWKIKKDDIDVCKDCEFRYICTDCRVYIKDSNNIYSQPSKCTYNPYIAKWEGQEGWLSVEKWKRKNQEWKENSR